MSYEYEPSSPQESANLLLSSLDDVEVINFSPKSMHPKKQAKFIDYSPQVFAKIRELSGISEESYIASLDPAGFLTGENNMKVSDGKSGSFFCFSADKKFILKTIQPQEAYFLTQILPSLLDYFIRNQNSLIAKFYGFHGIKVPGGIVVYIVVMANVCSTVNKIHELYDLKGSWVDRSAGDDKPHRLGLDMDFKRKLKLPYDLKQSFLKQIQIDSLFLRELRIMDYSLLLGLHLCSESTDMTQDYTGWHHGVMSQDGTVIYHLGIIDILQLYNVKKKLEVFAKTFLLSKDKEGISAVPPHKYSERFLDAMRRIAE